MAVQIAFVFQSPDRTDYLNQRLAGLIGKGIYDGASITPTGSGLTATRGPFFAIGLDGITLWDTEVGTFTYTTGVVNYHVLYARYNPLGTPSTPTIQELVLTEAGYNGHPDKAYLIVVAKITPAGAALINSEIDYTVRDEVGPFGRAQLRGVVDTEAELPVTTPNWNRSGDLYVVNNDPTPGGGGLYMWEGATTSWRLVAAKGAATLDGAYDNNGAGGPPGYGRTINVDAQAVELLQDNTSQRQNDIANAAFRIRKESTITGDGAIDIVLPQDKDTAGLLIRSLYTSGTAIQEDEPVNVSGSTITGTRVAANWNSASIPKANVLLAEVSGSSAGNNGLFIALPAGPSSCSVKGLNGSAPTFSTETGLTANFYSVRYSIGATGVARLTEYDVGSEYVASVEHYGSVGTNNIGKVVYYDPTAVDYVFQYRAVQAGASDLVCFLSGDGHLSLEPNGITGNAFEVFYASGYPAIYAYNTGALGDAIEATANTGNAISASNYSTSSHTISAYAENGATAVYGETTGDMSGVWGVANGSAGIGVLGEHLDISSDGYGVAGYHAGDGPGVYGISGGYGPGVQGTSSFGYGVMGDTIAFEPSVTDTFYISLESQPYWDILGSDPSTEYGAGADLNFYRFRDLAAVAHFASTDWPQGMTLNYIGVDWEQSDNSSTPLKMYAYRMRHSLVVSGAGDLQPLDNTHGNFISPSPNDTNQRRNTFSCNINNTNWNHHTDVLGLYFISNYAAAGDRLYGVYLNATFRTVSKWYLA